MDVRYEREGKYNTVKATLKDWSQLPGHEFRARTDCGEPTTVKEEVIETPTDNGEELSGIHEFQALELKDVQIFPNPSNGEFVLSFTTEPRPLFVSITDTNGKVVYREKNDNGTGYYNRKLDIKDFPTGNYILSVTQDDKVFTQQLSKQ